MLYYRNMNEKRYKQIRIVIGLFSAVVVMVAVSLGNIFLAAGGVIIGMFFMVLARSKTNKIIDEREIIIREKAAQMAYAIFAPTIGLGSFLLIFLARDEHFFLEAIGIVLAYLSLFLISLYTISFFFYNRKYGGDGKE